MDLHFYLIILELSITCGVMWVLSMYFSFCRVPIVVYVSERAKKCFDYCSTIFIVHLIVCICFYVVG